MIVLLEHIPEYPTYGELMMEFIYHGDMPSAIRTALRNPIHWKYVGATRDGWTLPKNDEGKPCMYEIVRRYAREQFPDYIDLDPQTLTITFIPYARRATAREQHEKWGYPDRVSAWESPLRQSIKPGRFLSTFLADDVLSELHSSDIEAFANAAKSYAENARCTTELVSGDDIARWYEARTHHLGSCMQGNPSYYFDLYTHNPDHVSMLVAYNDDEELLGRGLVWTSADGERWLDRVYGIDHVRAMMRHEAQKLDINTDDDPPFDHVPLKHTIHDYYPYLDTFAYIVDDGKNRGLWTDDVSECDGVLRDTGGGRTFSCSECGDQINTWTRNTYDGMCESCYGDRSCPFCGDEKDPDEPYCETCDAGRCRDCDDVSNYSIEYGYCRWCAPNHTCSGCGSIDESCNQAMDGYCDDCRPNYTCDKCLRIVKEDDGGVINDAAEHGMLCGDCMDDLTKPEGE